MSRVRKARLTDADYSRLVKFLRAAGATVATAEVTPERIKVVTTEGAYLTLPKESGDSWSDLKPPIQ